MSNQEHTACITALSSRFDSPVALIFTPVIDLLLYAWVYQQQTRSPVTSMANQAYSVVIGVVGYNF